MALVKDLGNLKGSVLLFGGPYSNLEATCALFKHADQLGIARANRICTGDLVAYCANPVETIAMVRQRGGPVVAGNCEKQLAQGAPDCGCGFADGSACSTLSRDWYSYARARVSVQDCAFMADLPDRLVFRHAGKRYAVIHGGASDISRFIWPCSPEVEYLREIKLLEAELGSIDGVISGHSGMAIDRNIGDVQWINAGAIGMPPNDGQAATRFAILSGDGLVIETLTYDHSAAVKSMQMAGLTQGYHTALAQGYWPSEDILPTSLRRNAYSRAKG